MVFLGARLWLLGEGVYGFGGCVYGFGGGVYGFFWGGGVYGFRGGVYGFAVALILVGKAFLAFVGKAWGAAFMVLRGGRLWFSWGAFMVF